MIQYIKTFKELEAELIKSGKNQAKWDVKEADGESEQLTNLLENADLIEALDYEYIKDFCHSWYLGKVEKSDINYLTEVYKEAYEKEIKRLLGTIKNIQPVNWHFVQRP